MSRRKSIFINYTAPTTPLGDAFVYREGETSPVSPDLIPNNFDSSDTPNSASSTNANTFVWTPEAVDVKKTRS
jgi:hypothetical protein